MAGMIIVIMFAVALMAAFYTGMIYGSESEYERGLDDALQTIREVQSELRDSGDY